MNKILPKLWDGLQTVGGFVLGFCLCLFALCLLVWAFEALQRLVS